MKYEEGEGMAEYWKCKTCGKINYGYVGTCGCGGLKADGIQASEEDYKKEQGVKDEEVKKKWQCPNCLKINEGDFCACGYVKSRSDKYIDENTYSAQQTYTTGSGNKRKIAIIIAVIIGLIIGGNYMISGSFGIGGSKIEGTYIYLSPHNSEEIVRYVLKDGKYKCYYFKNYAHTGSYKYDKNTNKITMDGDGLEFYYGKDVDGMEYIRQECNDFTYAYYYKR